MIDFNKSSAAEGIYVSPNHTLREAIPLQRNTKLKKFSKKHLSTQHHTFAESIPASQKKSKRKDCSIKSLTKENKQFLKLIGLLK